MKTASKCRAQDRLYHQFSGNHKQKSDRGAGTGDFNIEYEKVNARNSPELPAAATPHNMHVLELMRFGAIVLLFLFSILYAQIKPGQKNG